MMKKFGIALIAMLLCASLMAACTPGYALDRVFSFFGGLAATPGNADAFVTGNGVIYVSMGNAASGGNAVASYGNAVASFGNAVVSSGNAAVATSGNAANAASQELPEFTIANEGGYAGSGMATPSPVPVK